MDRQAELYPYNRTLFNNKNEPTVDKCNDLDNSETMTMA